jgi:hypothetical protein
MYAGSLVCHTNEAILAGLGQDRCRTTASECPGDILLGPAYVQRAAWARRLLTTSYAGEKPLSMAAARFREKELIRTTTPFNLPGTLSAGSRSAPMVRQI